MDNVTIWLGRETDVEPGDRAVLIGAQDGERIRCKEARGAPRHDQLRDPLRADRARPAHLRGRLTEAIDSVLTGRPVHAVRLRARGRGPPAWIVGGSIRDALLGRPVIDVDVAVAGDAEAAARSVGDAIGGADFPLSEAFGAWRAIDPREEFVCDVAPLAGDAIDSDLAQRDFTVNAMAVPIEGGRLIDPHGGRRDLDAGVLRVLGERSYAADPLPRCGWRASRPSSRSRPTRRPSA